MTAAAFTGTYADIKLIRSRSVMQIIVEVPIEQAETVIAAFGVPQPGAERPVAVALLNSGPLGKSIDSDVAFPSDSGVVTRDADRATPEPAAGKADGQPAAHDKLVQRVAILCGEEPFQEWIAKQWPLPNGEYTECTDEDAAAESVRRLCGVASRRELSTDRVARQRAEALLLRWDQHSGRAAVDWRSA